VVGVYRRIPVISEFLISNQIQKFKFKEITTMTKLTLTEQEELFAKDCKLINLRYEYTNYTGKEKWAVVTELTEKKLRKKYPDIIKRYTPFVLLSMAQGEVINESDRNDDKYEKRAKRTLDVYGYEDDISEQFHRELITPFADPFEQAEEEQLEIEKEQLRRMEIAKVRKVLEMMKPIQKERLCKVVLLGLSSRKIAQEEGVNYSAVDKSIAAAIKNFKKYYENL
jgi:chromatin SPT2